MPSILRHLLVTSALLSTLLGGLGRSLVPCHAAMAIDGSAPMMDHSVHGGAMAAPTGETDAGHEHPRCCPASGEQDAPSGDSAPRCPPMAHCGSAVLAWSAILGSTHAVAELPQDGRVTRPLDPWQALEPDPPKA